MYYYVETTKKNPLMLVLFIHFIPDSNYSLSLCICDNNLNWQACADALSLLKQYHRLSLITHSVENISFWSFIVLGFVLHCSIHPRCCHWSCLGLLLLRWKCEKYLWARAIKAWLVLSPERTRLLGQENIMAPNILKNGHDRALKKLTLHFGKKQKYLTRLGAKLAKRYEFNLLALISFPWILSLYL